MLVHCLGCGGARDCEIRGGGRLGWRCLRRRASATRSTRRTAAARRGIAASTTSASSTRPSMRRARCCRWWRTRSSSAASRTAASWRRTSPTAPGERVGARPRRCRATSLPCALRRRCPSSSTTAPLTRWCAGLLRAGVGQPTAVATWPNRRTCVSVPALHKQWFELNRCTGSRTYTSGATGAKCVAGVGCAANATLCAHANGCYHQQWARDFPAATEIVAWFASIR